MKCLVIYYSQTGSTAKIARAIHKGAAPLADQCDLAPLKQIADVDLSRYDLIGLGTPVWNGGFPPNVAMFVENLPAQQGRHIFSFCTHGIMPELYFPSVTRRLTMQGFTVIGMGDWYGSVHIQLLPKPYFTDGHPDAIDLQEAEAFGGQMVETSRRISAGETDRIPPLPDFVLTPQLLALLEFYKSGHNPHTHGPLVYDREKCNYPKCRLCQDNCTMGYIDLSADPPRYGSEGNGCDMWMGCTFCELICPTGAISHDWEKAAREHMKIAEFFGGVSPLKAAHEKALASGRLRQLVPNKIEGPYFKVYSKRPRFKIPRG
jgi:flavodoxin/NAD-dependent dihydropyrimidine dehydrogenase PreA subunit